MLPELNEDPIDPAEASDPIEPADPTERADPTLLTDPMEKALLREAMLKIEFSDQRDQVLEGQVLAMSLPCQVHAGLATGLIRFLGGKRSRVT
jgi:hypothetical protein